MHLWMTGDRTYTWCGTASMNATIEAANAECVECVTLFFETRWLYKTPSCPSCHEPVTEIGSRCFGCMMLYLYA